MNGKMKKLAALMMAIFLVMGMYVPPIVSANELNDTLTLGFGTIAKDTTKVNAVDTEVMAVPVTLTGPNATYEVRQMQLYVSFDNTVLELVKVSKGTIPDTVDDEEETYKISLATSATKIQNANENSCFEALFSDLATNKLNHVANSGDTIMTLYFTFKAGQEAKTSDVSFAPTGNYAENSPVIMLANEDTYKVDTSAKGTVPAWDGGGTLTEVTANVTFKVVGGTWNSGSSDDVRVPVTGASFPLTLTADKVPAVGTKPDSTHKSSGKWDTNPSNASLSGDKTFTYTYDVTPPDPSTSCATSAVYGVVAPELWTIRHYRDEVLGESWYGRMLIKAYYSASPVMCKVINSSDWVKDFFRVRLDKMVDGLQADGFGSTPYNDLDW